MIDLIIVGGAGLEQVVVGNQERRGIDQPFIPNQRYMAVWFEDPGKFVVGFFNIELMKRLSGGDQIDRGIR